MKPLTQTTCYFLSALLLGWLTFTPAVAVESGPESTLTERSVGTVRQDPYAMDQVPRRLRKTVFRAATLSKRGEHERVVSLLDDHLADDPDQDHHLLRLHLGRAQASCGRYDEAMISYRAAVDMYPELDRAWIGLGDAAYKEKDYAQAAEAFEEGFRNSPERPVTVLYSAAAANLQAGQAQHALELFQELETGKWGDMKSEWYRGLAASALQADNPEAAEPGLRRMLSRYPDDPASWYLMYQFAVGRQDYEEAAMALTITGYLRELTANEHDQLGDLYHILGVPALAAAQYRGALPETPSASQFEKLVSASLAAHDTDAALAALKEALALGESAALYSLLGDVHYRLNDYQSARESFAKVLELDPEYSRAYLMVGYCSVELGEKEAALDNLGKVSEDPDLGEVAQLLIQRAIRMPEDPS